jgi:hypothetical protein
LKNKVWYHFGNIFKVRFRKHFCGVCQNQLIRRKHEKVVNYKSTEAKYYDFSLLDTNIIGDCTFIHKVFYCSMCNEEIEFITQLSIEDNEKWIKRIKDKLLSFLPLDSIHFVWVDLNDGIVEPTNDLEKIKKIVCLISLNNQKKIEIICSLVDRKKYWERPYYFIKNKTIFKEINDIKQRLLV